MLRYDYFPTRIPSAPESSQHAVHFRRRGGPTSRYSPRARDAPGAFQATNSSHRPVSFLSRISFSRALSTKADKAATEGKLRWRQKPRSGTQEKPRNLGISVLMRQKRCARATGRHALKAGCLSRRHAARHKRHKEKRTQAGTGVVRTIVRPRSAGP